MDWCFSTSSPVDQMHGDAVTFEAGLLGTTKEERRAILKKVLQVHPYISTDTLSRGTLKNDEENLGSAERSHQERRKKSNATCNEENTRCIDTGTIGNNDGYLTAAGKYRGDEEDLITNSSDRDGSPKCAGERPPEGQGNSSEHTTRDSFPDETKQAQDDSIIVLEPETMNDTICSICLNDYEEGDRVLTGTSCPHVFHEDCAMAWLEQHDHCPYCRKFMITPREFRETAVDVLGQERITQLVVLGQATNNSQSSSDREGGGADLESWAIGQY